MPAPTTSTSTAAGVGWRERHCTERLRVVLDRSERPVRPMRSCSPDRAPKERYFDPDFFRLEAEQLWPRVWQMACRLEEIPRPHDFVEYEILDQSIVVVRDRRHGRAGLPERLPPPRRAGRRRGGEPARAGSPARSTGGATAPTARTRSSRSAKTFAEHNLKPDDIDLTPVRCEVWGGCAWINLDDDAPPLRECLEPVATILDAWKVESLRAEWWYACRLPVNWKLAEAAFVGAVPRAGGPPAARASPGRGTRRATVRRSTPPCSSTPSSTTCAR